MASASTSGAEEERGNEKAWKVVSLLTGLLAARVAGSLLNSTWRKLANAPHPPTDPESPDTSWAEAVAWAALSGAAIGLTRFAAARGAAAAWVKKRGTLPPGVGKRRAG
jgi:Protein of unknown function (DUF4235)